MMSVVLEEDGHIGLTNTSKHCILHTVQVLLPQQGLHTILPKSGSHKIDNFCSQLADIVSGGAAGGKGKRRNSPSVVPEEPLVNTLEVNQFYEGALSVNDFSLLIERRLIEESNNGDFDADALHRVCWSVYHLEKRAEISFPRWFSDECMYRLWLIFNTVLEPKPNTAMTMKSVNEILKRLVELCGYTWNPDYEYTEQELLEYPQYLEAITRYFEKFGLDTSLTCEVIQDMRDEIVDGVIKKGYLTKKGHKRRNWKRRWFVLQRTIMRYFESREKPLLKGQLVLNGNTEVRSMPDKGKRMYCFEVTCGKTGVPFEICSDDQRSKHEWMLAIKKAIALAQVLEGSAAQDDFAESLAGFYLLKYGTPQPKLSRQDSTIRKMKFQVTLARQRKRLSGRKNSVPEAITEEGPRSREGSLDDQDEYIEIRQGGDISSDDSSGEDEEGYLHMNPAPTRRNIHNYQNVAQSLPATITGLIDNLGERGTENGIETRRKSPSLPAKVQVGFDVMKDGFKLSDAPEKEEGSDSDESYEDIKIAPEVVYPDKMLGEAEDLPDGYVHLVKNKRKDSKEIEGETKDARKYNEYVLLPTSDAPPTDALPTDKASPTEEDKEVADVMSKKLRASVSLDEEELDEKMRASSPNKYLTIIRSDDDDIRRSYTDGGMLVPPGSKKKGAGPPIPPRRRSPGSEFRPPPISPRQVHHSMKPSSPGSNDAPPTPPPRPAHTLIYKMASSPVLPNSGATPTSGSKGSRPTRSSHDSAVNSKTGLIGIAESCEPSVLITPTDSNHHRSTSSPPLPPKS